MTAAIALLFGFTIIVYLVFFKFKWLKFNIAWGVVTLLFGAHLLLIFMIGLRFVAPQSIDVKVIQHTIQLTPRLPEPTLVTAVLVEPNVPVKKGQPLFQFDRTQYEYSVRQLEARLAEAKQNVLVLEADIDVNEQMIDKLKADLEYAKYQLTLSESLAQKGAGPEEDAKMWASKVAATEAGIKQAQAEEHRTRLRYQSDIGGVNTTVAAIEAELAQARFYLDNTTVVAPEDGYIINLQVRPGMVAGSYRIGAIASFICDADRYALATFFQENLKYVKPGQTVELAIDLYPGQIFPGTVQAVWRGSGAGQMLPSGFLPEFKAIPTDMPQGQFAVAIHIDETDQTMFPIGTQGRAAIYTDPKSGFSFLRKVEIRTYSWFNFLYPFSG